MSPIKSNVDQFRALLKNSDERPIVMLNLLKFNKDGGAESYAR